MIGAIAPRTLRTLCACTYLAKRASSIEAFRISIDGYTNALTFTRRDLLRSIGPGARMQDLRGLQEAGDSTNSILVRDRCAIVVLPETKAIIHDDHALVCRSSNTLTSAKELSMMISKRVRSRGLQAAIEGTQPDPFELQVLDAVLEHTVKSLRRQLRMIAYLSQAVVESLNRDLSQSSVQVLLPIHRSLNAFHRRLELTHTTLDELLQTDEDMANIQFTIRSVREVSSEDHQDVEVIVESYRQVVRELLGECDDIRHSIDDFQNMLDTRLDMQRNQLIRLNFHVSLATLGTAVSAFGAGLFGMNFPYSGFEDPQAFIPYAVGVGCTGFFVWAIWLGAFNYALKSSVDSLAKKPYSSVANLLGEVHSVDDALRSLQNPRPTHDEMREILQKEITSRKLSRYEVEAVMDMLAKRDPSTIVERIRHML